MTRTTAQQFAYAVAILVTICSPRSASAQITVGTWARSDAQTAGHLTMTIEACCNGGLRILYRIDGHSEVMMSIETPLDGRDVPVMAAGKPSGETMGIKRVDATHIVTTLKMNGKQFGMTKSTLSADGKALTVENEITSAQGGLEPGKTTEKWALRK